VQIIGAWVTGITLACRDCLRVIPRSIDLAPCLVGGANRDRTGDLYNAIVRERCFLGSSEDFINLLSIRFVKEYVTLTVVEVGPKLLAISLRGFRGASGEGGNT